MQIQYIPKTTNLVYIWVFVPTFENLPEKITHEIEHKLFFNKQLLELVGGNHLLSNGKVDVTGSAYYGGIRLEFSLIPEILPQVLKIIEKLPQSPLPNWTKEEKKRFQQELSEDDSFIRLTLGYKKKVLILKNNQKKYSLRNIWKSEFDFQNTKILIVGNVKNPIKTTNWKNVINQKINRSFYEKKYLNWYKTKENYVHNLFFSVTPKPENYVLLKLIQNIFYEKLVKQYLHTGRAYDITVRTNFEKDVIISSFDIDTNDKEVNLPQFKSTISEKDFKLILEKTIFEDLSDDDVQAYGCFPVVGFLPDDVKKVFKKITYTQFLDFYKLKLKEISIYWL